MKKVVCTDNAYWNGTIGKEYEVIKQDIGISVIGGKRITYIFYTVIDDLGNEVDVNINRF